MRKQRFVIKCKASDLLLEITWAWLRTENK